MDKLTQLLEKASDTHKVELKIHHNAQVACLKAYNDDPTAARARQKDLKAAQDALEDVITRLWPIYAPQDARFDAIKSDLDNILACFIDIEQGISEKNQAALKAAHDKFQITMSTLLSPHISQENDYLSTPKEAMAFLAKKGFKIAKSKFYSDCKNITKKKGDQVVVIKPAKVHRQKDGSFLKKDLLNYAGDLDYRGEPTAGLDQDHRRKLKAEIQKLELQKAHLGIDLKVKEGQYMLKEKAFTHASYSLGLYDVEMRNMTNTEAAAWILLVDGNTAHAPRLIDAIGHSMDKVSNRMAKSIEYRISVDDGQMTIERRRP